MKVLNKVNWNYLYPLTDSNLEQYLCTFNGLYNYSFPINKVCLKLKTFFNPWMNKGPNKLSKRKEKLYDKFFKSKTNKNEKKYKTCKTLFEMLREKSKKLYYSRKLDSCKKNMMKTWDRIKEVVGKTKTFENECIQQLYKYFLQNYFLYENQFGSKASNSTDHPVIQLVSKILGN